MSVAQSKLPRKGIKPGRREEKGDGCGHGSEDEEQVRRTGVSVGEESGEGRGVK